MKKPIVTMPARVAAKNLHENSHMQYPKISYENAGEFYGSTVKTRVSEIFMFTSNSMPCELTCHTAYEIYTTDNWVNAKNFFK